VIAKPEQRRLRAPGHGRERGERRGHRQDRRQREQPLVGALRPQFLLEQELENVGERLQRAVRPDQVRAVALLHEAHDLALGQHEQCRRVDQHEEGEADHHELNDET